MKALIWFGCIVLALVLGGLVCMISSDLMVTLVPIVPACFALARYLCSKYDEKSGNA